MSATEFWVMRSLLLEAGGGFRLHNYESTIGNSRGRSYELLDEMSIVVGGSTMLDGIWQSLNSGRYNSREGAEHGRKWAAWYKERGHDVGDLEAWEPPSDA